MGYNKGTGEYGYLHIDSVKIHHATVTCRGDVESVNLPNWQTTSMRRIRVVLTLIFLCFNVVATVEKL